MIRSDNGYFGEFGGRFVPEILLPALTELEELFFGLRDDPDFWQEYLTLTQEFSGRPTPLTPLRRLSKKLGGAQIWLKREDLNHSGAHKVNNVLGQGLLVLLGLDKGDDRAAADAMLTKLLAYRIFADHTGRMNRSVADVGGGVLLVSQFTLSADTRKGLRPSFSSALPPVEAESLYDWTLQELRQRHTGEVAAGIFGADMQVGLINDGPVTFLLEVSPG